MPEPTLCCPAGAYCDRCDLLVGLDGLRVIDVVRDERDALTVTVESEQPASLTFADAGVGVSVRSSVAPASPEHLTAPVVIEPGESALVRVALDENLPGPAAISMAFYSDDPRALGGHPVEARTN